MRKLIGLLKKILQDLISPRSGSSDATIDSHYQNMQFITNKPHIKYRTNQSYMLAQDMVQGAVYFTGEINSNTIHIQPTNGQKETCIASGISSGRYHSLYSAFHDFLLTVGYGLFQNGTVTYEVVHANDKNDDTNSFRLVQFRAKYFFKLFNHYYQLIPWWEAKKMQIKPQIIKVAKEKVFLMDFPSELGGKRNIKKLLKRLYRLNSDLIPSFEMEALTHNINTGFNFDEFTLQTYLEVAQLTKDLGWNQRKYLDNNITEYYAMKRFLNKKRAQVLLRNSIMAKLNELINNAFLNLGVEVIVTSQLTLEEINKKEQELNNGDLNLGDWLKSLPS